MQIKQVYALGKVRWPTFLLSFSNGFLFVSWARVFSVGVGFCGLAGIGFTKGGSMIKISLLFDRIHAVFFVFSLKILTNLAWLAKI